MTGGAIMIPVRRSAYDETAVLEQRSVPVECPIAIEISGIAYAVMMASPIDLEDFVTGFLLSEGLVARVNLPQTRLAPIMERVRRRLGDSSCGICGIESVEAALRPLPKLSARSAIAPAAIKSALTAMRDGQILGAGTAATHAAAFAGPDGSLVVLREDVGRHNALDKLVGVLARQGIDPASGFMLVTSRCSYELVEKAARAGCPLLVAISAPTDLAVRRAQACGLALAVVARDDSMLWVTGPEMEAADGL